MSIVDGVDDLGSSSCGSGEVRELVSSAVAVPRSFVQIDEA